METERASQDLCSISPGRFNYSKMFAWSPRERVNRLAASVCFEQERAAGAAHALVSLRANLDGRSLVFVCPTSTRRGAGGLGERQPLAVHCQLSLDWLAGSLSLSSPLSPSGRFFSLLARTHSRTQLADQLGRRREIVNCATGENRRGGHSFCGQPVGGNQ